MRTDKFKPGDRVLVYSETGDRLGFGRVALTSPIGLMTRVLLDGGQIPVWISTDRVWRSAVQELIDEYKAGNR